MGPGHAPGAGGLPGPWRCSQPRLKHLLFWAALGWPDDGPIPTVFISPCSDTVLVPKPQPGRKPPGLCPHSPCWGGRSHLLQGGAWARPFHPLESRWHGGRPGRLSAMTHGPVLSTDPAPSEAEEAMRRCLRGWPLPRELAIHGHSVPEAQGWGHLAQRLGKARRGSGGSPRMSGGGGRQGLALNVPTGHVEAWWPACGATGVFRGRGLAGGRLATGGAPRGQWACPGPDPQLPGCCRGFLLCTLEHGGASPTTCSSMTLSSPQAPKQRSRLTMNHEPSRPSLL